MPVFLSGDGVWRHDTCSESHGVICQKFILTSIEKELPVSRAGKSFAGDMDGEDGSQSRTHRPPDEQKKDTSGGSFANVSPFLLLFSFFFVSSLILLLCVTKVRGSYATIDVDRI